MDKQHEKTENNTLSRALTLNLIKNGKDIFISCYI